MKCQKCGMNEVNFHYSKNVNGSVTETYLCSQCATESGYDIGKMFNLGQLNELGSIFNGMFPTRSGISGFMPMAIPVMQSKTMFPFTTPSHRGMIVNSDPCGCGCGNNSTKVSNVEVDEEMSKRRELNAMMRAAVEREDFEKAAELRDQIKDLEARRDLKCDSETTSQDSPPVQ